MVLLPILAEVLPVAVVLAIQEAAIVPEQSIAVILSLAWSAEIVHTSREVGTVGEIVSEYSRLCVETSQSELRTRENN